jgi:type II secretory pathway pseudopilin PulG
MGITLMELVVGIGITALLVAATGSLLLGSTRIWARRSTQAQTDTDVALAMQRITRDLSQAMAFSIEDCGRSIYFVLPARAAGEATFQIPVQAERDEWGDIRTRWYRLCGSALYSSERDDPLITDMPEIDPETGEPYFVFSQVPGAANRLQITLISRGPAGQGDLHTTIAQQITVRNSG